jgi:hypothetical protein
MKNNEVVPAEKKKSLEKMNALRNEIVGRKN